jgi:hypothetical protein
MIDNQMIMQRAIGPDHNQGTLWRVNDSQPSQSCLVICTRTLAGKKYDTAAVW